MTLAACNVRLNGLNGRVHGLENGNGTLLSCLGHIRCIKRRSRLHGPKR
jgi:hypothetical protein